MKKIYAYLLAAILTVTLSSCDKDAVKALVLDGTWTGYIETYYQDRWGVTSNTFRTTMYFQQESIYGGIGYEVDYDLNHPYQDYYYCEFTWTVRDRTIYINYADSWNTVRIYDYNLNLYSFRGYMDDGTHRDIYFDLSPTSNFDWQPYQSWRTRGASEKGYHASGVFAGNPCKSE